ncbi:hypothetical protein [Mycobacterium sp. TY815]|uniref:hypothetical protein n=1 Tax=Mycobacterium sp. TY815 TaxID=3050581 RepID=UPI0027427021|nr:hypothetical protein [Mycobacterium sp. TY815]MDP7703232.1 hypothetical protein [Mycobacterium sp. TY815]
MSQHLDPTHPPFAVVFQDQGGPMIRTSPFGQSEGVHMSITIEDWRRWNAVVEKAVTDFAALHLSAVSL